MNNAFMVILRNQMALLLQNPDACEIMEHKLFTLLILIGGFSSVHVFTAFLRYLTERVCLMLY